MLIPVYELHIWENLQNRFGGVSFSVLKVKFIVPTLCIAETNDADLSETGKFIDELNQFVKENGLICLL